MKSTIFGAGAIGGQIAVRLAQCEPNTAVVVRGEHLAAIKARGIVLLSGSARVCSMVRATDDAAQLGPQDLVIVTVKAHSLVAASAAIQPLIGENTHLLYVMNGIPWWFMDGLGIDTTPTLRQRFDPDGRVAGLVPPHRFAWGVIRSGGAVVEPGVIRNTTPDANEIVVGVPFGTLESFRATITGLADAGYEVRASQDIRLEIWSKLLINAGPAVLSTLVGLNNRETVEDAELRGVATACIREIIQVGAAIGIRVKSDPADLTDPARTHQHISSLLQDLRAGRPVEIAHTILAVRDIARATSVPAPHLTTLAALIASRLAQRRPSSAGDKLAT